MTWATRSANTALALCALAVVGCGTPGPPQPPSLHLPGRVNDLSATRDGNQVVLAWTMPKRDTDRVMLTGAIAVRICRAEAAQPCTVIGNIQAGPAAPATFSESLPPALAAGPARPLAYFVELRNQGGRSAGQSNAATVLAGQAPPAVTGLTAQLHKSGIVLQWQPDSPRAGVRIRLHRTLLTPAPAAPRDNPMATPPEPAQQDLLVPADTGRALDRAITVGRSYEYRAQRIERITIAGQAHELAGELSSPVRIEAADIFPPDVPTGLLAVAGMPEPGAQGQPYIDLSWQPAADADLAGYIVYRRQGDGPWQRISGAAPSAAPAFHDPGVQPGQSYIYAVSAVDRAGHESARSDEARETVPQS